jgi:hypothetical protein
MRVMLKGVTSQSIYFVVLNSSSTTGARLTGLVFNSAGLTAYYVRQGGSATAITLATLAAANSAYSSGGFREVDATNMPGIYRLDIPDAALASGVDSVVITLKGATNMVQVDIEIQLSSVNLQDAVRGGMTALPNANAEAAGGLFTRGTGAGQINQDANGRIDGNVVAWRGTQPNTLQSGRVDAHVGAVANGVIAAASFAAGALDAVWSTATRTLTAFAFSVTVGTNNDKTGYGLSAAAVQAIWDALTSALTTAGSIGKLLVDNINAALNTLATASGLTTVSNKLGAWTGSGRNTVLGALQALFRKDSDATVPTDVNADLGSGAGTANNTTDSLEGQRDGWPANFSSLSINGSGRVDVGLWLGSAVNALISGRVDANAQVVGDKTGYGLTASERIAIWDVLETAIAGAGGIGLKLKNTLPVRLTKNTAFSRFMFVMVQSADHLTPATGLTVTATRSLDGASFGACANSPVEVGNGVYYLDLAAADVNANCVTLRFTATGADARLLTLLTQPAAA